ncbi:uncharacterized protein LOC107043305 [Diachasma alloeum]|uniref:uncharacterized protein LOC107043305 n=1 Tax=Diachasma alloeum TaxID=454923 RepID=UPI0007384196|nr:uncharacterized protein LOC107043305 [Diachasma alloeum]
MLELNPQDYGFAIPIITDASPIVLFIYSPSLCGQQPISTQQLGSVAPAPHRGRNMRSIVKLYLSVTDFVRGRHPPECDKMVNETSRLLDTPVFVDLGGGKCLRTDIIGDYDYYAANPLWIKIRLLLFWIFWAALILVIILSVSTYFCLAPSLCSPTSRPTI